MFLIASSSISPSPHGNLSRIGSVNKSLGKPLSCKEMAKTSQCQSWHDGKSNACPYLPFHAIEKQVFATCYTHQYYIHCKILLHAQNTKLYRGRIMKSYWKSWHAQFVQHHFVVQTCHGSPHMRRAILSYGPHALARQHHPISSAYNIFLSDYTNRCNIIPAGVLTGNTAGVFV